MIGSQLTSTLTIVAFAVGLVLLWLGWRGRKLDDHPWCRKCKFDLYGRWPGATVCPECGGELDRPRAVSLAQRRKRPLMILIAAIILIPLFWPAATGTWRIVSDLNWNRIAPEWWLVSQVRSKNQAASLSALDELDLRVDKGRLSKETVRKVIDDFNSSVIRKSPAWSYFLSDSWSRGLIQNDQKAALWGNLNYALRTRRGIAEGDEFVVGLQAPLSPFPMPFIVATCEALDIDGKAQPPPQGEIRLDSNRGCAPIRFRADAAPGIHAVSMTLLLRAFEVQYPMPTDPVELAGKLILEKRVTLSSFVNVLPSGTASVALMRRPLLPPTIQIARVIARRNGAQVTVYSDYVSPLRGLMAFSESYRAGQREWIVGHLITSSDSIPEGPPSLTGFDANVVDVVLRPNPELAARTFDMTQIWGEEIVIPNVPVVWENAADSQPATPAHAN